VPAVEPLTARLSDVCFVHWPVDADRLEPSLPSWLTVDTADGTGWLTAVAHTVDDVSVFGRSVTRPVGAVNVRTYVRGPGDRRGVYFLALYVDDHSLATVARSGFELPYRTAVLSREDGPPRRRSLRSDGRELRAEYDTADGTDTVPPGSLAGFLIERERYFTTGAFDIRLSGSVGHDPWQVAPVDATVDGRLPGALPTPSGAPLVHHSPGIEMALGPPTPMG